jgi:putative dimethyl sulfoxide reductase chaperone
MTGHVRWAAARGDMYRFLSGAFVEPPREVFVAPLLANGFVAELEEIFGAAAVEDLRRFVSGFEGDYAGLVQEFQDLFMVPLGRYVTPYEAVYRDERQVGDTRVRGLLMGPSTLALKELYREAGVQIAEDFKDLPDHVGLELACMAFLCDAESRAWERDAPAEVRRMRDFQRRLLQDHLLQWVPALCSRIREKAAGPFYRGIARLTQVYLESEVEALPLSAVV